MKVALCLQGQPRNWKPTVSYMNTYVIKPYNADVFGHTWWDESLIGKKYEVAPFAPVNKSYFIEANAVQELKDAYNFKKFKTDAPRKFIGEKRYNVANTANHDSIIDSLKSRYFSLKNVLMLLEEYEQEQKITYDWVCISRYDLAIRFMPQLILLNPRNFFVEDYMHHGRKWIMNDNFIIFSKKHRYVYKTLFDDFDKNYEMMLNMPDEFMQIIKGTELERVKVVNGEEFMALHLLFNGAIQDAVQTRDLKIDVIP
jgi:hypothetical protein